MENNQKTFRMRQPFLKNFVYSLYHAIYAMKISNLVILPVVVLSLAFSCEKREDISLSESEKQIPGQWNWIESVYYYTVSGTPYIMNPDSLGYSVYMTFSEDGTFATYRNSLPESSGTYWFETIRYENGTESPLRLFTREDEYVKSVNFSISADTLILDETEVDGAKRVFVRNQN
jgi:hypothetical protein